MIAGGYFSGWTKWLHLFKNIWKAVKATFKLSISCVFGAKILNVALTPVCKKYLWEDSTIILDLIPGVIIRFKISAPFKIDSLFNKGAPSFS